MRPTRTLKLGGGVELLLFDAWRECATRFPDGSVMHATRENSRANRLQADEDGYGARGPWGDDRVWAHLAEHEAAHTLWARAGLGGFSRVLRHECGAVPAPYCVRIWEESCVLAVQRAANGLRPPDAMRVPGLTEAVSSLRRLREVLW